MRALLQVLIVFWQLVEAGADFKKKAHITSTPLAFSFIRFCEIDEAFNMR